MGATMGTTLSNFGLAPKKPMPCQEAFDDYMRCCKDNENSREMVDCEDIMFKFRRCMEKEMAIATGYSGGEGFIGTHQGHQKTGSGGINSSSGKLTSGKAAEGGSDDSAPSLKEL
eukprot:TRINITY_DN82732_c0_g1_i1.p1 TRINITY_DN82732_c0_g1~~TRINITY_DN82732_c0_g1_i1.p1  ORF type:complete len:115 (+),score=20.60 TRINITY_DN82732_c0_g1_i1:47-391(+)